VNKENQINYLQEELERVMKMYLSNEVIYRSLTSTVMSSGRDDKLLGMQTDAKKKRQFFQGQIRNLRGLVKEIEKGEFDV
tara:strand:+ start:214 stop:453 length:240 start_codon:yes stop_codon:yes gene_type:complete